MTAQVFSPPPAASGALCLILVCALATACQERRDEPPVPSSEGAAVEAPAEPRPAVEPAATTATRPCAPSRQTEFGDVLLFTPITLDILARAAEGYTDCRTRSGALADDVDSCSFRGKDGIDYGVFDGDVYTKRLRVIGALALPLGLTPTMDIHHVQAHLRRKGLPAEMFDTDEYPPALVLGHCENDGESVLILEFYANGPLEAVVLRGPSI